MAKSSKEKVAGASELATPAGTVTEGHAKVANASLSSRDSTAQPLPPSKSAQKKRKRQALEQAQAPPTTSPSEDKTAPKNEIDDLFGKLKSVPAKPKAEAVAAPQAKESAQPAKPKRPAVGGSKDDLFGTEIGQGRKRTEEGFAVYTEDELGWGGRAGESDLCPFDCQCCF